MSLRIWQAWLVRRRILTQEVLTFESKGAENPHFSFSARTTVADHVGVLFLHGSGVGREACERTEVPSVSRYAARPSKAVCRSSTQAKVYGQSSDEFRVMLYGKSRPNWVRHVRMPPNPWHSPHDLRLQRLR